MSCAPSARHRADSAPVIVIPSRPGVPLIVNGRDIAYAVLEGDWGLGKSVHVQPTVYPGNWRQTYKPAPGHYYPHTGRMPGYGRLEIETAALGQLHALAQRAALPPQLDAHARRLHPFPA